MSTDFEYDRAALHALFEAADGPLGKMLKRLGLTVQRAAKRNAPVDTGRLRSSITEELTRDGDELVETIGTDVEYGLYVEVGTHHAPAHPYLRPALDSARNST